MQFELFTDMLGTTYLFLNGKTVRVWNLRPSRFELWHAIATHLQH